MTILPQVVRLHDCARKGDPLRENLRLTIHFYQLPFVAVLIVSAEMETDKQRNDDDDNYFDRRPSSGRGIPLYRFVRVHDHPSV
jgi:hypothetical protein